MQRMQQKMQTGNSVLVLSIVISVVLLISIGTAWWIVGHPKTPATSKPTFVPTASADQPLNSGNSNQDIQHDASVLSASTDKDKNNLQAATNALDDKQTILAGQ